MADERVEGWKNGPTAAIARWIDNDRTQLGETLGMAAVCREGAPDSLEVESGTWTIQECERFTLADMLKDGFETRYDDMEDELAHTLVWAALSDVDWHELADHYLAKLTEGADSNHYTHLEPMAMSIKTDDVIYWVRSVGPDGKDRVPMFFKGQWTRNCEDGMRGDVKGRPVSLGPGEFTATYNPDDFENEDGTPVRF